MTDGLIAAMTERMQTEQYRMFETDYLYAICRWMGFDDMRCYRDVLHPAKIEHADETEDERLERFGIKVVG